MKNHEADAVAMRVRRTADTVTELAGGIEPAAPPDPAPGAQATHAGQDAPDTTDPSIEPGA